MPNIAIIGSRKYARLDVVEAFVANLPADTQIISGGARGVDSTAAEAALRRGLGLTEIVMPKGAYKARIWQRNKAIVNACDYIVAFWDGASTGTAGTMKYAIEKQKPFAIFGPDGYVTVTGGHEHDHDGGESALQNAMERVDDEALAANLPTIEDAVALAAEARRAAILEKPRVILP